MHIFGFWLDAQTKQDISRPHLSPQQIVTDIFVHCFLTARSLRGLPGGPGPQGSCRLWPDVKPPFVYHSLRALHSLDVRIIISVYFLLLLFFFKAQVRFLNQWGRPTLETPKNSSSHDAPAAAPLRFKVQTLQWKQGPRLLPTCVFRWE